MVYPFNSFYQTLQKPFPLVKMNPENDIERFPMKFSLCMNIFHVEMYN